MYITLHVISHVTLYDGSHARWDESASGSCFIHFSAVFFDLSEILFVFHEFGQRFSTCLDGFLVPRSSYVTRRTSSAVVFPCFARPLRGILGQSREGLPQEHRQPLACFLRPIREAGIWKCEASTQGDSSSRGQTFWTKGSPRTSQPGDSYFTLSVFSTYEFGVSSSGKNSKSYLRPLGTTY